MTANHRIIQARTRLCVPRRAVFGPSSRNTTRPKDEPIRSLSISGRVRMCLSFEGTKLRLILLACHLRPKTFSLRDRAPGSGPSLPRLVRRTAVQAMFARADRRDRHVLAATDGIRVIASALIAQLNKDAPDIPALAQRLDIHNLIEGTIREEGNRLRITVMCWAPMAFSLVPIALRLRPPKKHSSGTNGDCDRIHQPDPA